MNRTVLQNYEEVLMGRKPNISRRYFEFSAKTNEKTALSVFRYAIETHLRWSPKQAQTYFTDEVATRMKLKELLRYIEFPSELDAAEDLFYVVHLLYPKQVEFDLRSQVLSLYKQVLDGTGKFPKTYYDGTLGSLRACICLQYALTYCEPFPSIRAMYETFGSMDGIRFLKEHSLFKIYIGQFNSPIQFLHAALPRGQRDSFYYAYYSFRYWNSKQKRFLQKHGKYIL